MESSFSFRFWQLQFFFFFLKELRACRIPHPRPRTMKWKKNMTPLPQTKNLLISQYVRGPEYSIYTHTYMYIQYIHPTLCHTISLINNAQVIVTFNFIQAHSYLHKKYIPKSWKLLNGDRVLVSIAWGCLAIILHGIRHSLFQLLKIRAHEKWQRGRKKP